MLLNYLAQLTAAWGLFWLLYQLFFRQETFFQLNRWYLLLALGAGLVLPFSAWLAPAAVLPFSETLPTLQVSATAPHTAANGWTGWIAAIWGGGSVIALARLLQGLWKIKTLIQRARPATDANPPRLFFSKEISTPISFLGWVVAPDLDTDPDHLKAMLAHEQAHCKGLHSVDILFLELILVAFWWHPLVYWYKSALRTVHEYIADAATVQTNSRKQYGLLLIQQAQSGPAPVLAHHFYQSPLKQRLVMLTKTKSAPIHRLKYALFIPAVLLLTALFQPALAQVSTVKDVEQAPQYPGGTEALVKFLASNLKYPEAARKENAEGLVVVSFVINKKGKVENVQSIKGDRADFIAEAIRVVKMTKWEAGVKDGKKVKVQYALPIKFKLS